MSNIYSWVAEKKEEAMKKKLQKRGMPNYNQLTPQDKYGVSYTGLGQNGQLDRGAVAGTDLGAVYHEGELRANLPEGQVYVNSDVTQMMMKPRTIQERGFQSGGYNLSDSLGAINQLSKDIMPKVANTVTVDNTPKITQIKTPVVETPKVANTIETPKMANVITTPNEPRVTNIVQPKTETKLAGQRTVQPEPITIQQPVEKQLTPEERANLYVNPVTDQTTTTENQLTPEERARLYINPTPADKTTTETIVTPEKSLEDQSREKGMNWFLDALNKENPALMLEGRRAAAELSSRQQQERSAMEQQLLQQGVDPGRARLEGQMLRDKQESELNDLAAKYGVAGMQARERAAGTLASQGLAGQQFEEERNRYKDSADWKAYEAAIAAGDFETAAKAYQTVTGKPISMDQMKTYQNYVNTRNQQELTQGELAITSLKTKVGDEKWNSIQSRIASGASLAQVNSEFPGLNLTQDDFKNMYDATPLGERTWERNMSYAKTLLEAGGAQNITSAAGIFNQAFPGTGIDFSKLITADNAATVNKGMSQLSDLVASGMDYDSAIEVMKKNGTLEMMGMNEADVEKVYRGMKVNAIDEQWKTISDSDWYKGLPPADQKDMSTFFSAVLNGQLDYKVQKEYTVTNKDGSTSTMYFNDAAAANSYGTANGATMVATGKSKVTPITDVLDESGTGTTTTTTTKRTEPLGTVLIEGGKIYQVIADGKTQEITPDVDDPFSDNNKKIIDAGEKDNPYYKTIFDKQYSELTGGNDIAGKLNTSYVAGTNYNLDQYNKTFDNYKDVPFENPIIQKLKKDLETTSTRSNTKLTIVKDGNSWKITRA